jgi:hypothetical protein
VSHPVFDTPEGLEAIIRTAGFADIQIFSEAEEFTYATEEECWSTSWSHGARETLEGIEKATGSEGLGRFKSDVLKTFRSFKRSDGIHLLFPVLFAFATKKAG